MRHSWVVLILLAFATATIARAEVIQLKNGDRLSGSFRRVLGGKVILKTDKLGTLTIPVAEIAGFTSQTPAVVILKDGKTSSGIFSLTQTGAWQLQSAAGTTTLQADNVVAIYPAELYEKERPGERHMPWQDWEGQGTLGYVLQQSSQHSKSLSINFTSSRVEPTLPGLAARRATHFSLNMAFATVTQSGVTTEANTLTSVLRQDFFFGRKSSNYLFLQGQWDHIQPQELTLRQSYGGGVGRNLIQRPSFTFAVQGGATYVRTSFATGELRNEMEALAGEKLTLTLLKHLSIDHEFNVYPSLTSPGDYRFNSLTALNAPISERFSFNISLNDQFLSRPVPGTEQNVVILSTGLGIKL